jgi:dTDP-4-amino-4,6-dideoxygalactose transaminase
MPCAIARAQLAALPATTARAQRNGARLSERLAALPGIRVPQIPAGRTHVFHKYRVRLDPAAAGIALAPRALRDLLLAELRAEGVEAVLWQTMPLPAHPLFGDVTPYPCATAALDSSVIIGSQSYPLFGQPPDVIEGWAEGFEKAWARLRS